LLHSLHRERERRSQYREQVMTTSEIGLFFIMAIAAILWALMSYSVGYKEGQREGFKRGRAIARHAVKEVR
jgi:hypothetical protein